MGAKKIVGAKYIRSFMICFLSFQKNLDSNKSSFLLVFCMHFARFFGPWLGFAPQELILCKRLKDMRVMNIMIRL